MLLQAAQLAFVHIPKTGGTSLEVFFCGHDWITASREDYAIYLAERARYSPTWGGTLCDRDPDYFAHRLEHKHATQAELRAWCGPDWAGFRKFTFLRNPWQRLLSIHAHGRRDGHGRFEPDFRAWLRQPEPLDHMGQRVFAEWIDDWQELVFVGRFERLAEDFQRLLTVLAWPHRGELPHEHHGGGGSHDVEGAYDDETRAVVARRCAAEIAVGGYRFGR